MIKNLKIRIADGVSVNGRLARKELTLSGEIGDKPVEMEIEDELIEGGRGARRIEAGMQFQFFIQATDKTITIKELDA